MRFRARLGYSDFLKLRRAGVAYVDKTALVTEVLEAPAEVLLLPRPRRFGKTLNLSTLRCFLERTDEDRSDVFEGLAVWESEVAHRHFRRYPVVFLTFKDVKLGSWERCERAMAGVLARAYREHRYLLDEGALHDVDAADFRSVLERRADPVDLMDSLRRLCGVLHAYHGEPVVLLVDEYDTPIHAGHVHGYYEEVIEFLRNLLSGGLKDNPHLFRGVVTGILRVARESIFSGLNNLAVYSLLRPEYATAFGFTEAEVERLADLAGARDHLADLRDWYDGYLFGGHVVYNPWSVLSFLASAGRLPCHGRVPGGADAGGRCVRLAHAVGRGGASAGRPGKAGRLPCHGQVPGGAGAGGRCVCLARAVGRGGASAGRPGKAGRLPCPGQVPGGAGAGGRCICLALAARWPKVRGIAPSSRLLAARAPEA